MAAVTTVNRMTSVSPHVCTKISQAENVQLQPISMQLSDGRSHARPKLVVIASSMASPAGDGTLRRLRQHY